MSDEISTVEGTTECNVCGLEVMAMFAVTLPPIGVLGGYATCPVHVDTVIARLQDHVHEIMATYDGALVDWWQGLHPPETIEVVE